MVHEAEFRETLFNLLQLLRIVMSIITQFFFCGNEKFKIYVDVWAQKFNNNINFVSFYMKIEEVLNFSNVVKYLRAKVML